MLITNKFRSTHGIASNGEKLHENTYTIDNQSDSLCDRLSHVQDNLAKLKAAIVGMNQKPKV